MRLKNHLLPATIVALFFVLCAQDVYAQARTAIVFVIQGSTCDGIFSTQQPRFRNATSGLPQDGSIAVGAIAYASNTNNLTLLNLTQLTPGSFQSILDGISRGFSAGFGPNQKNLAEGIRSAANMLSGTNAAGKIIFVVTDSFPDSKAAAISAANIAKQQGILVYPIIFDGKSYSPTGQCADALTFLDQVFINSIASFPPVGFESDYAAVIIPAVLGTPYEVNLPRIVDGQSPTGTSKTSFLLVNPAPTAVSGTIDFFNGAPLSIPTGGAFTSTVSFTIPANGTRQIQTDGTSAMLVSGWARVRSNGRIGVTALINQFDPMGNLLSQTAIDALPSGAQEFSVFAQLQPTSRTGIIMANPHDQAANVLLTVVDQTGSMVLATRSLTISRLGQVFQTLTQLFPALSPFNAGRLVVSSNVSLIATGFIQTGTQTEAIPVIATR
jgi:hypothetical protein